MVASSRWGSISSGRQTRAGHVLSHRVDSCGLYVRRAPKVEGDFTKAVEHLAHRCAVAVHTSPNMTISASADACSSLTTDGENCGPVTRDLPSDRRRGARRRLSRDELWGLLELATEA